MRIGLDVRYLSHGLVGGIHTYLKNLVPALLSAGPGEEFVLYADTKRPFDIPHLGPNARLRLVPYRGPLLSVWNDLFINRRMAQDQLDVAHFTASYGFGPPQCPTVVTLQDEINILPFREIVRGHAKNIRTLAMMSYLHVMTAASLKRADLLITVSEYSKGRIAQFSSMDPTRIVTIPHACPQDISRVESPAQLSAVQQRLGITRRFVLAEAFKNPAVLVRSWKLLPENVRRDYQIVFFSRSAEVLPVVHEAVRSGFATLLVRPAREDLAALYSAAEVFVFPSWIEGFGIPLLEAMTCGAPVIASDRGAIPEVVGDAAIMIDAEDHAGLSAHLLGMLIGPRERERWRARGLARAAQFSWPDIAGEVLACYRSLAA
jgi:glycosyltransferase involved in cell wall biosynthesis